jgi:hypothetical protein
VNFYRKSEAVHGCCSLSLPGAQPFGAPENVGCISDVCVLSHTLLCEFPHCRFCSRSGVGMAFKFILTLVLAMSEFGPAGNYMGAFPGTKCALSVHVGLNLTLGEGGAA